MFKKLRGLLAARKAARQEDIFTTENALSPVAVWQPEKTYRKSSSAATGTAVAAGVSGGSLAALLILIRTFKPDTIPWEAEKDTAVVAAITPILGSIVAFIRKWRADRKAHGGNTQ